MESLCSYPVFLSICFSTRDLDSSPQTVASLVCLQVFPYLKTVILTEYHSKEDLVHAIATSCHIPAYCDGSFIKEFRGQVGFNSGGLFTL